MSDDGSDLLEQYKFYAGTSNDVSNRRLRTNRFYVSLLSGILVVIPFVLDLDNLTALRLVAMVLIGFVGVILCILWYYNIKSYKQLNEGKYDVIHAMEEELPFDCYTREWEILGKGKDRTRYITHWSVERWVPRMLAIPYIVLVTFGLWQLL